MLNRRILILNPLGLHARAAAKLVPLVTKCESSVILKKDGTVADAKSILSVLALAAGYGTFVEIEVAGPDEQDTMARIEKLFLDGFEEI